MCVLMVVAALREQNKFCLIGLRNVLEQEQDTGRWRGDQAPLSLSKQQIAASIIHTLTTQLMANTCHFSLAFQWIKDGSHPHYSNILGSSSFSYSNVWCPSLSYHHLKYLILIILRLTHAPSLDYPQIYLNIPYNCCSDDTIHPGQWSVVRALLVRVEEPISSS